MECEAILLDVCQSEWCRRLLLLAAAMQGRDEAHGLPHSLRVACIGLKISLEVGYSRSDLVIAAALLHDIGRGLEELTGLHHAEASASLVPLLLSGYMEEEDIREVATAVLEHSYSYNRLRGEKPSSLLSCILSDADKIDAVGAVGVARAIIHGYVSGRSLADTLQHYYEKLSRLDEHLCLDASRRIAQERVRVMREYFDSLEKELSLTVPAQTLLEKVLSSRSKDFRAS